MIEYIGLTKIYRTDRGETTALDDISLRVEKGALCVLLGSSGCGKTTLLRTTNRLVEPTSGTVMIHGRDIMREDPVPLRRRIGYAIQGVGLFPHKTVAENVAVTLRLQSTPKEKIAPRVDELLEMMNLDPAVYADRYPAELSGGEAQRVGVARALAADPPLLLMDEPFGAIDPVNRKRIGRQFRDLQKRLGTTTLFVSHDVGEALALADTLVLMRNGRIVQAGAPSELLTAPVDDYTAQFFGEGRELLLLETFTVADAMRSDIFPSTETASISANAPLRHALALLLAPGVELLGVLDESGRPAGSISLDSIRALMAAGNSREIPS